jgi:hypothetical protein
MATIETHRIQAGRTDEGEMYWINEMEEQTQGSCGPELVKQIQLDAYKAGMSEAAKLTTQVIGEVETLLEVNKRILTARDNKTTI